MDKPAHEILVLIAFSSKEGLGESAQVCRPGRTLDACIHKVRMNKTQFKFRPLAHLDMPAWVFNSCLLCNFPHFFVVC